MPDGDTDQLLKKLKNNTSAEVYYDNFTKGRYATDASIYQMVPYGVLIPKTKKDLIETINYARESKIPLLARGGGTSQCGQTVNKAIVIDNSKFLNKIIDFDKEKMTCIVEPGIVLDELNRFLKPFGLWFPVDVSTSSRATIGGMAGNNSCGGRSIRYGMMRDNVLDIEAILYDGSIYNFGKIENNDPNVSNGVATKIILDLLRLAKDNQEVILAKFPKVLRRVGGYNIDALLPDAMANRPNGKVGDGINLSHLLVGSEGTLAYSSSEFTYPADLYRVGVVSVDNVVADRASHEEVKYINLSPLTAPVKTQPVYSLTNTGVVVYPSTVTSGVKLDYLRQTIRPKWGYVLNGTIPYYDPTVFDPATDSYDVAAKSYNFDLHPSEENNLVVKILNYAGVVIKQGDVTGFAQGKEQQNAATEQ